MLETFEMPLTAGRERSGGAFAVSAVLHALMVFLIFNIAFSADKRLARGRVMLLYTPPPAPARRVPRVPLSPRIPTLPSPVPSLALPIPPRPAPAATPEPSLPPTVPPPSEAPAIRPPETAAPRVQPAPASFAAATVAAAGASSVSPVQVGRLEGPRVEAPSPEGRAPVASAGFSRPAPGERLRAGSPATTGAFGDGTTLSAGGATPTRGAPSATGGFGSIAAAKIAPPAQRAAAKPQFETVRAQIMGPASRPLQSGGGSAALEILHKPRPEYSAEGRLLKIEGEVVLDVLFAASGEIRVLRVLHGLGHGLDESAARAAAAIQFRPAVEHGQPADTVATVRIQFQLAD